MATLLQVTFYRVFNKEGQKVLGYKTWKKCAFEATKRLMLIASKNRDILISSQVLSKGWLKFSVQASKSQIPK